MSLSLCLSVSLSACMSVCLYVCLSVCLSVLLGEDPTTSYLFSRLTLAWNYTEFTLGNGSMLRLGTAALLFKQLGCIRIQEIG